MASKPRKTTDSPLEQFDKRRSIDVGPKLGQVSTVAHLHRVGQFKNDDESRGAFRLAHLQALDGMGATTHEWMGLTDAEFDAWYRNDTLPAVKSKP